MPRTAKATKLSTLAAALAVGAPALACGDAPDAPEGYYASAEGLAGAELEDALHPIIDDHTVVAYSWPPFLDVDESKTDPSHVDLIYSNRSRAKSRNGGSVGDWNREHLWPRSFGIYNDGGADNADLFNLRPSDVQVNSERGSLIFDKTDTDETLPLQFDAPGCSKDSDSWEPRDDEKGDIARACFYMHVRYDGSDALTVDLELSDAPERSAGRFGSQLTLLRWHRLDPPDNAERQRNHAVFSRWQGNRNPFIDRPEFAELLFLADYPTLDDDGDGLPDWWEYRTHGDLSASAADDIDGDGAAGLLEFAMASNPLDANQRPEVRIEPGDELSLVYRWNMQADALGIGGRLEVSSSLAPDSWQPAAVAATERTPLGEGLERVEARLPPPAGDRRFFRLSVTAP